MDQVVTLPLNQETLEYLASQANAYQLSKTLMDKTLDQLANLKWVGSRFLFYTNRRLHILDIDRATHAERAEQVIQGARTIARLVRENPVQEHLSFLCHTMQGVQGSPESNCLPNDDPHHKTVATSECVDVRDLASTKNIPEYQAVIANWDHKVWLVEHHEGLKGEVLIPGLQVDCTHSPAPGTRQAQNFLLTQAIIGLSSAYPALEVGDFSEKDKARLAAMDEKEAKLSTGAAD